MDFVLALVDSSQAITLQKNLPAEKNLQIM